MSPDDPDHRAGSASNPIAVLAFHKLFDKFSYSSTNYSPRRFITLLRQLAGAGFSFDPDSIDPKTRSVLITFDDGYAHLADILPPLIGRFRIKPVIFIPSAFIGQDNGWDYSHWFQSTPHLNRQQIRELGSIGVKFGSHGHTHVSLTGLSHDRLAEELKRSMSILEDISGQEVDAISYPFGRVNDRVTEAASAAGYRRGFTMRFPSKDDSSLRLGRFAVYGFDSSFTILQRLNHGPLYPFERAKAGFANLLSGGTVLLHRLSGRGETKPPGSGAKR